ncbi:MAG: COG1470 family protein [Anaerolineae bacterium]
MSLLKRSSLLALLVVLVLLVNSPVLAQEGTQTETEAEPQPLLLFTRYPSQEMAVGQNVTMDLVLRAGKAQTVRLEVQELPAGWMVTFRGQGRVIHAAHVQPDADTTVELRIEPPEDVSPGTYRFTIVAQGEGEKSMLNLELIVQEKLPPSLEWTIELPTLRGAPETTFRYNATLKNAGDEDLTVNLIADAPSDFRVSFKLGGQDVVSFPINADESKRLTIEAQPLAGVSAGSYPITVLAQGGEVQARLALTAEVTGKSELNLTTPDGRLSASAHAGEETPLKLLLQNTGTAPAYNIKLSASQPAGWTVKFEPEEVAELPANQQVEVTVKMQPASKAIAGDYVVTIRARPDEGSTESAEFRITVLTSTLWGVVGVVLIAVAVGVVALAVMRFGRR